MHKTSRLRLLPAGCNLLSARSRHISAVILGVLLSLMSPSSGATDIPPRAPFIFKLDASPLPLNVEGATHCQAQSTNGSCEGDLPSVLAVLNAPSWQKLISTRASEVRVVFPSGVLRIAQPIDITWQAAVPLRLIASNGNSIIDGSQLIHFTKLDPGSADPRLPSQSRAHVWVATLPIDVGPLGARGSSVPLAASRGDLFAGEKAMPIAGWPNDGFTQILRSPAIPANDKTHFQLDYLSSKWQTEDDLYASGYWYWNWAYDRYPVIVTDDGLALRGITSHYGIKTGQRVRIENALSELDNPGEWYLDHTARQIYWWPSQASSDRQDILDGDWSVSNGLLHIDHSSHVTVNGLVLRKSRGDGVTIQHSSDVHLDGVSLSLIYNRALVVDDSDHSGISNSTIRDVGMGGADLSGGDRIHLIPASNYVRNTRISNFGTSYPTYGYAITMAGVGQLAENNIIQNAPHLAIIFSGNDHRIIGNDISRVVLETADAGAIYTGRDFTARGTVIQNNYIHDVGGRFPDTKGVYLDDQASGITVTGNIFSGVPQAVYIGGGRDNHVDGNVFYHSSPALTIDDRGLNYQRQAVLDPKGMFQTRLHSVPIDSPIWTEKYPRLKSMPVADIGKPEGNTFSDNQIVGGQVLKMGCSNDCVDQERNKVGGEELFRHALDIYLWRHDAQSQ